LGGLTEWITHQVLWRPTSLKVIKDLHMWVARHTNATTP
jgi:hypothetical protein